MHAACELVAHSIAGKVAQAAHHGEQRLIIPHLDVQGEAAHLPCTSQSALTQHLLHCASPDSMALGYAAMSS